jgi:tRNA threonylcarbamoyladenosine biosynthesis protein TsaE
MKSVTVSATSPQSTKEIAERLADLLLPGDLLLLIGGLGAGKTTFTQGLAKALGVEGPVTSPTFTLVRQYSCRVGQLLHADLYRLSELDDMADLGLDQLREEGAVVVVEWGEGAEPVLGRSNWQVRLEIIDEENRMIAIESSDDQRLETLSEQIGQK